MKGLGYDGTGIGNHDFNYGLASSARSPAEFRCRRRQVRQALRRPGLPAGAGERLQRQDEEADVRALPHHRQARHGDRRRRQAGQATVKVGIIGFTPPTILSWDKRWLEGKVYTEGLVETAKRYIPEMRAKGADVVVVISHGGLDDSPYTPEMENGNWHLAQVPGIDAMLLGHSHQLFPNRPARSRNSTCRSVDKVKGTVFGVPTVMANMWGKQPGRGALQLRYDGKRWTSRSDQAVVESRAIQQADKSFVAADPKVAELVRAEHEATIRYVKTPVGSTGFRMSTYFADVGDVSALQAVNQAQTDYVRDYVRANLPQYAKLPVLSMSAAFKSGFAGPDDFTDVPPGSLALNNAADLYLYPNALYAVKVDGAGLKAWLETAAQRFNTIDPARPSRRSWSTRLSRLQLRHGDLAGAELRDRRHPAAGQAHPQAAAARRAGRRRAGIPGRDE
jgi:2',3'-cyclic-nucleotide 2'-phosphodiesterase/3'-nucleotidase